MELGLRFKFGGYREMGLKVSGQREVRGFTCAGCLGRFRLTSFVMEG